MSYHRRDAEAFYDHWKQFRAPRYFGDLWPDNFMIGEQGYMDKEYHVFPEQFYSRAKLPMVTPNNVDDFISHMNTFQGVLIPLLLEVRSGKSSTSFEVRDNQCIALPPVDYRYGWDLHRDDHRGPSTHGTGFSTTAHTVRVSLSTVVSVYQSF